MLWKFNRFLPEKPCQTGIFAKMLLLMLTDVALLATIGIILPRAPSAVQGVVPRLPRLVSIYALASAARAASFMTGFWEAVKWVTTGYGKPTARLATSPPGRSGNINSVM